MSTSAARDPTLIWRVTEQKKDPSDGQGRVAHRRGSRCYTTILRVVTSLNTIGFRKLRGTKVFYSIATGVPATRLISISPLLPGACLHPNTRKSGARRGPRNPPRAHFNAAAPPPHYALNRRVMGAPAARLIFMLSRACSITGPHFQSPHGLLRLLPKDRK